MLFHKFALTVVLILIGVLQISSADSEILQNSLPNNGEHLESRSPYDFIIGEETPHSQLIRTERITQTGIAWFDFSNRLNIVKIEALDQGAGGSVTSYYGGVNTTTVTLFMQGEPLDFIINVYVESFGPADLIIGNLTENSVLLHTERVSGKGYIPSVEWRDVSLIITRLEVLDQTNGFGGSTNLYDGGIDRRFVWLAFNNWDSDIEFDSIVNIYGYPVTTNDVIQGEITDSSSLVHSVRIFDELGWSTYFQWNSAAIISRLEIIDQSNGNGGFVSYVRGGAGKRSVEVRFDPMNDNGGLINFFVYVYAEPVTPNDFSVGELTSNSWLVHRQRISQYYSPYYFSWNGPFAITRIEAHDQSNGYGGFVTNVNNGSTTVGITFESVTSYSKIEFFIDLYGEPLY